MAIESILDRNPTAFKPKIEEKGYHAKGCHCKKSNCLKKYCECYQSGVPCTELCICEGCKNCDENMKKNHHVNENENLENNGQTNETKDINDEDKENIIEN